MKMKKVMKIVVAILVAVTLIAAFAVPTFAANNKLSTNMFTEGDNSNAANAVSNIIGNIIYIARVIGMGVAIIMLIVLAIQYIAASPEGKAEIKKKSTIYIVGAVILFAASAILGIIQNFTQSNFGDNTTSGT